MKKVIETATSCVYRKAADIVNWFTLTNLSHQTVKHIVMQSGEPQHLVMSRKKCIIEQKWHIICYRGKLWRSMQILHRMYSRKRKDFEKEREIVADIAVRMKVIQRSMDTSASRQRSGSSRLGLATARGDIFFQRQRRRRNLRISRE